MSTLNHKLLEKLSKYKLKIMADVDGDVHFVQCVIRVSITPFIKYYSNDVFYKAKDMTRCKVNSFEDAVNICMQELVDRLEQ